VERWQDAEAAIAYLKRTRGGRATFLPLDSLRPPQPTRAPRMPGVLGVASDLITADPRLGAVVRLLLGRTIVVEDLPTARQAFARADAGVQVVTLDGDIVRPGGSVTGGSEEDRRSGGVLARERERRALPEQIELAAQAVAKAREQAERWREAQHRAEAEVVAHERAIQEASDQRAILQRQLQEHQRALDRARQAAEWHRSLVVQAERRAAEGAQQVTRLQATMVDLEAARMARARELAQAEADLRALADGEATARATEARAAAVAAEAECRSQEALLRQAQESLHQAEAAWQARERRLADLTAEREQLAAELAGLRGEAEALQAQIDRLAEQTAPAEAEINQLATAQASEEAQEARVRQQVRQEEASHHQAQLALERAQDELSRLRREIDRELGPVALEPRAGEADQPPLPLHPLVESLPMVTLPPEGLEGDIQRLRTQLSRLGHVNPDAPAEYAETMERHAFLSAQLTDLNDAVAGLQQVIAELNALMDRDFKRTFDRVAACFQEHFSRLFGGGSARLELTDPDNLSTTGIEIIAHLPGKRAQSLALLSGGERALTAAALIFALLEANPPPFCILDEVDAALDEANIERFRETLKTFAERIQFIVITHNRGTVEVADTIYGISIAADGVSRVLSLSMKDVPEVA
jgi:chromosome segregation protein